MPNKKFVAIILTKKHDHCRLLEIIIYSLWHYYIGQILMH